MQGKFQGQSSAVIDAPTETVWTVLNESALLPQWLAMVKNVTIISKTKGGEGEVRSCNVDFAGKAGIIVERCVECVPCQKISYRVDSDSLGFNKLFIDYQFTYLLEASPPRSTLCTMTLHYTPRGIFSAVVNLLMKRKFSSTRQTILHSLKAFAEANG